MKWIQENIVRNKYKNTVIRNMGGLHSPLYNSSLPREASSSMPIVEVLIIE